MKTPVIALLTSDQSLEECATQAVREMGGLLRLAHSANDVLDLMGPTGHLDLAMIDCEHGPHGLTLVGAIKKRRESVPVIVLTGRDDEQIEAVAYGNGATLCLSKPVSVTQLKEAIRHCPGLQPQLSMVA